MDKGVQTIFVVIGVILAMIAGYWFATSQKRADDQAMRQCMTQAPAAGMPAAEAERNCRDAIRQAKLHGN